jgi:hypothetical protein
MYIIVYIGTDSYMFDDEQEAWDFFHAVNTRVIKRVVYIPVIY